MIATQRNLSVETLRGITILLVVMGHVIGSAPEGGMKIDFPHPLRYFYLWIDYIQMPLFTAIAGWVYALKPSSASGCFAAFARKKALRLLVPMAVVGTLYFVVQYMMPGTNNKGDLSQMWRIYVFPFTIYWYLPSLFLIFMVQWCIDRYKKMESLRQWMMWCIIAMLVSITNDSGFMHQLPNLFSFKGALGQLPYFFAGVAACRFAAELKLVGFRWILGAISLLGIVLIQVVWLYPANYGPLSRGLYVVTLIPTLFFLLNLRWHNRFFTWVGGYAYSIYLLHGFGTSGGRILLKMLGVKSVTAIFAFASFIATILPVVADAFANRFRWLKVLLLGKR